MNARLSIVVLAAWACCAAAYADQIVQQGSLEGGLGIEMHDIFIDQFDEMSGTHQLNFVQLDFLTSLIGGGQSNGSNVPTHIFAQLKADYFLDDIILAETEALIDTVIANTGSPGSFTVFNTDTEQVILDQPAELAPWIGLDQILITAVTEFVLGEDPPGSVGFSAGGTVNYTVTYDFTIISVLGDVNLDGVVNLLDVAPFIQLLVSGEFQVEADINGDGVVDLLDIQPFVDLLAG